MTVKENRKIKDSVFVDLFYSDETAEANHEILERCPVLKQYGQFIDAIRKYQRQGKEEPYKIAIRECMGKGILTDYLRRKASEVESMLMAEYDYNTDIEVQREEAEEIGEKRGARRMCLKDIKKLHLRGWKAEEIADFVEMPLEEVEEIIREL